MHRTGLIAAAVALVAAGACKSKETPASPEAPARAAERSAAQSLVLDVPRDVIYAGSSHVRVVDAAAGQVVAGIDLSRSITAFAFTGDGQRGFVAASDGVRELDLDTHGVKAQLTHRPARGVTVSDDGERLLVVEHEVVVRADKTREVKPFELVTLDLATGAELGRDTIGLAVLAVVPSSSPSRHHLIVARSGEVRLVKPPAALSGGTVFDLRAGIQNDAVFGVRGYVARSPDGARAYLPLEGEPSRVAEIDLETGAARLIDLGGPVPLRGLAVTPDGKTLVVNGLQAALLVDLDRGAVSARVELGGAHMDAAVSIDGKRAYFAWPVAGDDAKGGAVTVLRLDGAKVQGRIYTDDISPWVIAVRPRASYAWAD